MTYSFNLIDKPWIPCLTVEDAQVELSLRDTLAQAHQLREIRADTPSETAALHRLLLAVTHWVFGPKDRETWIGLWRRRQEGLDGSNLDKKLVQWYARFDLFHQEHPFFQVVDETALGRRDTINKMIPRFTQDSTLFEHTLNDAKRGVRLTSAQAARALITAQYYSLGYQQFVDAPCARAVMFLIQGSNLLETLLLNLTRYPDEEGSYASPSDDAPAWVQGNMFEVVIDGESVSRDAVLSPNGGKKKVYENHAPLGRLDYLTWPNRKIKLIPEGTADEPFVRTIAWAPGMRLRDDVLDSMQYYTKTDKGWQAYTLQTERSFWRDLASFLRFSRSGPAVRPIASILWITDFVRRIPELHDKTYILTAFGMAKNKASLEYLRHETTPLPIALLQKEELVGDLSRSLQSAERVATVIRRSSFTLAWLILSPQTEAEKFAKDDTVDARMAKGRSKESKDDEAKRTYKLHRSWGVEGYYWSDLEVQFHHLIQALPDTAEQAMETWRVAVRRAANVAFDRMIRYAGGEQRAQRAAAVARQRFNIGLAAALGKARPDEKTKSNENGGETV